VRNLKNAVSISCIEDLSLCAELVGKDRAGQYAVLPVALSCLRRTLPLEMPPAELAHSLAKYTLYVDKGTENLALAKSWPFSFLFLTFSLISDTKGSISSAATHDQVLACAEIHHHRAVLQGAVHHPGYLPYLDTRSPFKGESILSSSLQELST